MQNRVLPKSFVERLKSAAECAAILPAVVAIALTGSAAFVIAQSGPPPGGQMPDLKTLLAGPPPILTIDRPQAKTNEKLQVTSSSFTASGKIPLKYTSYGQSISPELSWSAGPVGTKSYLLIFEDATFGMDRKGNLHWLVFNIAPEITSLHEGLSQMPPGTIVACCIPHDSRDGLPAYIGPHAPSGAPPFHYSLQVFALDTALNLTSKATREAVWEAMDGHVLAKGAVAGTFQGPAATAK